jgi:hypothetical protein
MIISIEFETGAANVVQVLATAMLHPESVEADLKEEAMQRDFLNVESMMSTEVGCSHHCTHHASTIG